MKETECTACGFPSEDDRWCEACDEVYIATDYNNYDLERDDGFKERQV